MSTTEQHASHLELRPLSPKATPEVFRAAQRLVRIKTALDDLCRSHRSAWIVEQLCSQTLNSAHSALDGQAFLWAVVPFIQDAEPEVPALVPLETMIGESWRWHECAGTSTTAEESQAYLTNPDRAFRTNRDASLSTCVAPLGLTVAFEGKNRVRFLRDRGVKYIPSAVAVADYPTPDRLKIIRRQALSRYSPRGAKRAMVLPEFCRAAMRFGLGLQFDAWAPKAVAKPPERLAAALVQQGPPDGRQLQQT